ncbi:MAG: multidrug ABC transporter substrate-binding protein [Acidobacteria bacterium]|nr:MAG: multidrug ABC transporter substrate-binding protein [Acidobacteriota bacterium]
MWARLRNKLLFLFRRERFDRELSEEMDFHREMLELEKTSQGVAGEAAAVSARRQLGNTTLAGEHAREVWIIAWLDTLAADLRYAGRTMAANKTFAGLAILSLALGIGANTAIYSFMDSILLRSLPVPDPESLVVLNWHAPYAEHDSVMQSMSGTTYDDPRSGVTAGIFPFPAYELFRKYDSVFSTVFAHFPGWQVRRLNVTINGHADIAAGWNVSGDYFGGLGVPPAAGRLILPDDDRAGAPAVAVVSYGFSQRRFGGPANAAGRSILVDNLPFTVVGVTPPGFFGVDPAAAPDVYLPVHTNELLGAGKQFGFRPEDYLAPNFYWVQVMGRLRPGVSLAHAQAVLAPPFRQWVASTATTDPQRANLPELIVKEGAGGLDTLRRRYSQPLYVLMALVGLILALACANVANLLLARAASRGREIALRLSVGASRPRIVRQLLTESVLLASLGGALGLLFAIWGIRFLTLLLANGRADFTLHAEMNCRVLGVTAALSLLTGVLFGLAPALRATRVDLLPALKETQGGRPARHRFRRVGLSHALVVGQIAVSLLMLVAAGLFVRTLANLQAIELGFNPRDLLLFQVDARKAGHKDPEIAAFYAALRERLSAIPGVRSASLERDSLIQGEHGLPIGLSGSPPNPANRFLTVGPAFFTTMRIPILAGRDFDEGDRPGSPSVAVINEVFAKANFGDRNPLGQHLTLREAGDESRLARDMEIVGVSRNARYGALTRAIPPVVYIPYDQGYPRPDEMVFALRTLGDPLRYVDSVREIVREADARLPVSEVRTQAADIDQTINQEITFAELCSGFAILALVIAGVGLYGTVSYNVARRTAEIGIRMALGAQRSRVVRMVLSEVLVLVAGGLAIGLAAALGTSRFVASLLYGMTANDPLTLALALMTLLGTALAAGYAPARKASRIDPMTALRQE